MTAMLFSVFLVRVSHPTLVLASWYGHTIQQLDGARTDLSHDFNTTFRKNTNKTGRNELKFLSLVMSIRFISVKMVYSTLDS